VTPRELARHKSAIKRLIDIPTFKQMKRGKWPKPFHRMGNVRLFATEPIAVSETHVAVFIWRDGAVLSDTAFFAHLFCRLSNNALYPLFEFHWHPSHKGIHAKLPCQTESDYTNRQLPGAPELALNTDRQFDPRAEADRLRLIAEFCDACGIVLGDAYTLWN
jgi:hypothetical protein